MENLTPVSALIGGLLIGGSTILMLGLIGHIAGISGILSGAFDVTRNQGRAWRWWFLAGLVTGAGCYVWIWPIGFEPRTDYPLPLLIMAGVLVGYGTRMGNGCTSGHGVCGLARLSWRSIIATITFVCVAMLTVYVLRHLYGVIA